MSPDRPCLVALAEHAELIRAGEIRRSRKLREDARLLALSEQVSTSVVAAMLRPIGAHVARHQDPDDAELCVRRLFGLTDALEVSSGNVVQGSAA